MPNNLRKYNSFAYQCWICKSIAYSRYSRGVELKGKCGHKGSYYRLHALDKRANEGNLGLTNLALGFINKAIIIIEGRKYIATKYDSCSAKALVEFPSGESKWIDTFNLS